jgi:hypothetical protein
MDASSLELEVAFESAVTYSQAVFESTGSPWKKFMNYADFLPNGREYIRKVQSDFGEQLPLLSYYRIETDRISRMGLVSSTSRFVLCLILTVC